MILLLEVQVRVPNLKNQSKSGVKQLALDFCFFWVVGISALSFEISHFVTCFWISLLFFF
jgi:hypothetical protein